MDSPIYIFNPENDMALANNTIYYKAPHEILLMAGDLSFLPAWFAEQGATVRVPDKAVCLQLLNEYQRKGVVMNVSLESRFPNGIYRPWGWNPSLIHSLAQQGVERQNLPSNQDMDEIRRLSGRQTTVQVLDAFADLDYVCGQAVVCSSLSAVADLVCQNGLSVVKSPWSGSGRGLVKVDSTSLDKNVEGWVSRILRTQGAVMVEPLYDKEIDFAMEFHADASGVAFCGYSIFETDNQGNYKCNVLATDEALEERLLYYVQSQQLAEVRTRLLAVFNRIIKGKYRGFFGVDMMICHRNGRFVVHPCVEINLRMNMGVVARLVYDRYVHSYSHGKYVVEHFFAEGEAESFASKMKADYPPIVVESRFVAGYFPLTPVGPSTRFHIYLLLERKDR